MKKIKLLLLLVVSLLLSVTGCEGIETDGMGNAIEESSEMEEYILAGLDFQHSLNQFRQELKEIDILSLTSTLDARSNLVINLPTKISIEIKAKNFNTKKKALLEKHPELKSLKSVKRLDHIKETVDNSLRIAKSIMEFEFSNQPRLRSDVAEVGNYESEADAFSFLDQQLASPNYVEVVLIVFTDGTAMTYIKDDFTAESCYYPRLKKVNGEWYLYSSQFPKPIQYIAHTHQYSTDPSQEDLDTRLDGLDERIYTSGGNTNSYND